MIRGRASPRKLTEWDVPRSYIVPRGLRYALPHEYLWNGPLVRVALGQQRASRPDISAARWPLASADRPVSAVLIVSAVGARIEFRTGRIDPEPYPKRVHSVRPRSPRIERLARGESFAVFPTTSRPGECLIWPLADALAALPLNLRNKAKPHD